MLTEANCSTITVYRTSFTDAVILQTITVIPLWTRKRKPSVAWNPTKSCTKKRPAGFSFQFSPANPNVQPFDSWSETLVSVQHPGRSPGLRSSHRPSSQFPSDFAAPAPYHGDEFVQDLHLFPFSPEPIAVQLIVKADLHSYICLSALFHPSFDCSDT